VLLACLHLQAVAAEGGERERDGGGAGDHQQAAGQCADHRGGQRPDRAGLNRAELRAARADHVIGRHHPAAERGRGDDRHDRPPGDDRDRVRRARDGQRQQRQPE